jgi:hypothetical protein
MKQTKIINLMINSDLGVRACSGYLTLFWHYLGVFQVV